MFSISGSIIFNKGLYKVNQYENEEIADQINDSLIEFRNSVIKRKTPETENPNKVINILEKNPRLQ